MKGDLFKKDIFPNEAVAEDSEEEKEERKKDVDEFFSSSCLLSDAEHISGHSPFHHSCSCCTCREWFYPNYPRGDYLLEMIGIW